MIALAHAEALATEPGYQGRSLAHRHRSFPRGIEAPGRRAPGLGYSIQMSTGSSDDLYGLLGVHAEAAEEELRRAWRRLALRWHPDRAGSGATATFQKLLAAYTVLSDPAARAAYDRR